MMKIIYCAYGRAALECLDQLMLNFDIKKSDIIFYTHNIEHNKEFIEHLIKNKFTYFFDNINNTFKQVKTFNLDYLISVYYRTIINYKILNLFNRGSMNLHPSLLPKYKGQKQTGESSYYSRELPFDGRLDSNKVSYNEASQFVKAMYFPPFKGALLLIKNEEIEVSSINDLRRHMGIS